MGYTLKRDHVKIININSSDNTHGKHMTPNPDKTPSADAKDYNYTYNIY